MRAVSLFAVVVLCVLGAAAQTAPAHAPIIDVHLHAYPIGALGPPGVPNPATGKPSPATEDAMRRENLAALELYNIVRAVTSGAPSELVRQWKAAAPERIIAAIYIGGGRGHWPEVDSLRAAYQAGELSVLGELGLQYQGLTLSSPEVEPYLGLAEELDIPVAVHTGLGPPGATYGCCPKFRAELGNPLLIEEALARHPKLRVYIMHAGYPYLEETIALLHAHPRVYADVAVIDWVLARPDFHDYLRRLMQHTDCGIPKRLMFGSDQMRWPESIGRAIAGIESADFLTAEEKRDIFYNNAARFLRLDTRAQTSPAR